MKDLARPIAVMVADDDPNLRHILSSILTKLGYEVDSVENGRLAFEACQSSHYDLVITDGEMPEVDGIEVTHAIRQMNRYAEVPIIGISGS